MTLEFVTKKRPYRRYHEDVTIRPFRNNNRNGIAIIFKNKSKERITKTGYLSAAVYGSRLYFKEMTKDEGYKASENGAYTFRTNILDDELYSFAEMYKGSYTLQSDEEFNLWYIQK